MTAMIGSSGPAFQVRSVISYFSGSLGTTVISLVASLLVARWTAPEQMGLWNLALLIVTYASALQLGVFNGLNRQLPYFTGQRDAERARQRADVALAWCAMLTVASVAIVALVALVFWARSQPDAMATSLALGAVLASAWSLQYLTVCYAVSSRFGELARKSMLVALAGLVMVLLVRSFGYEGLLMRAAVLAVLGSVVLHVGRPVRAAAHWDRPIFLELVRVGFPIWMLGQLSALFMTLDRLALADSPQALGYYTGAVQFASLSYMLPTAFNAVLYPQMAREYGESHLAMNLWNKAARAALWAALASLCAGMLAWPLIPYFLAFFLPAYLPGTTAAQWAAFTGLAMSLSVFGNIFNVLGRQHLYVLAAALGAATFCGAWLALTHASGQSRMVCAAQAMLLASLITSAASTVLSRITCRSHDRKAQVSASALGASS